MFLARANVLQVSSCHRSTYTFVCAASRLEPAPTPMTAIYLGNVCAALITVGLLVGTLRYTRRVSQ